MTQLTIDQIFSRAKFDVMSKVLSEYLKNGRQKEYNERTWIELLIVKHSIHAAYKMQKRGRHSIGYDRWCAALFLCGGCVMKILADLYYVRFIPHEHGVKSGSEYEELLGCVIKREDDLVATLTEQQKEIFEKYKDCKSDIDGMNELETFINGFKLATKNMMEVMEPDE